MSETVGEGSDEREARRELDSMIQDAGVAPAAIARLLDALEDEIRAPVVRGLGRKAQKALYGKVQGYAPISLIDLVPSNRPDLEEVRHLGRNSLPAFTIFEKRFCRLTGGAPDSPKELAGYNFQTLSPLTGPGYFIAVEDANTKEVLVDYKRLPDRTPREWPEVRSNETGLSRFVYGFMVDRLRRVSEHVSIGSAARNGRELDSYFVLCRAD